MTPAQSPKIGVLAVLTVIVVGGAAFFLGFYVLPSSDGPTTLWLRMCRAAGVVTSLVQVGSRQSALPAYTTVIVPHAAMTRGSGDEIGRGATLALRCTACHGAQGLSGANAPNLAGQYPEVLYKQLLDFKRGARVDAVMDAMVATLSDQNMLDLAHYYAYLPRPEQDHRLAGAPALVRVGDPMRSIAPCASCHGRKDGKVGAPALDGEPQAYLKEQLTAFANGTRRNDANAVMRGEARQMTASEITLVIDHYASHSEEGTR
jgi:cytochrome c553